MGDQFARVAAEWADVVAAGDPIVDWEVALEEMSVEQSRLRATGQWRSGGRTLLKALSVQYDEVIMCRGLAWLLTPDAWHGLGSQVLDSLLAAAGVDPTGSERATVVVEEPRQDTRADIIIRFGSTTVIIEAKVWAAEQPRQCDRIAEHWADESPALVFLTRTAATPTTDVESRGQWFGVAWSDFASWIQAAIDDREGVAAGALEYLETLKIYGGTRA